MIPKSPRDKASQEKDTTLHEGINSEGINRQTETFLMMMMMMLLMMY
jgi:hypothetical protein